MFLSSLSLSSRSNIFLVPSPVSRHRYPHLHCSPSPPCHPPLSQNPVISPTYPTSHTHESSSVHFSFLLSTPTTITPPPQLDLSVLQFSDRILSRRSDCHFLSPPPPSLPILHLRLRHPSSRICTCKLHIFPPLPCHSPKPSHQSGFTSLSPYPSTSTTDHESPLPLSRPLF